MAFSMFAPGLKVPDDLPGGVPLAAWRWDSGVITREEFEAVPKNLRTGNGGSCAQCARANAFKVRPSVWFAQGVAQCVVRARGCRFCTQGLPRGLRAACLGRCAQGGAVCGWAHLCCTQGGAHAWACAPEMEAR